MAGLVTRDVAATTPLVGVQRFVDEGVHHRPGNVGVAGGVGARGAVGDLAAIGGAALDGQEGLRDVRPPSVPLDATALDRVLGFEHQSVFPLKAVVNWCRLGVEVAYQVEHAVTHAGDIDANVLDVEALGQFFDLCGLVSERVAPPAVLLQDPELRPRFERRRDNHAGGVVAGAARVVTQPDWTVAKWPIGVRVVVLPQRQIRVAALQILEAECALSAVDELAVEQLLKFVLVVLQLQLLKVEQIAATGDCIVQGYRLAPLAVRTQCPLRVCRFARPHTAGLPAAFAVAKLFA